MVVESVHHHRSRHRIILKRDIHGIDKQGLALLDGMARMEKAQQFENAMKTNTPISDSADKSGTVL